ncbi:hypothetical protein IMZ08_19035 [Bacillus luteolus]|uniref:Lipoprotein n=1 Tax=Litchfieldia luteola TaxID=682179 RepID=A0ABR9QNQ5_9BACI|nr:PCYCGC motif-containing (lipo)protein [Cytobacillus luteolus]MBE4910136.1 hypothetical protein [Cytobacillus luteolus]MBP1942300.1 bacterioferritin-associated ferredoxin [Cytobacillus luteolus]
MRLSKTYFFLLLFILLLSACSNKEASHNEHDQKVPMQIGDIREETSSAAEIPSFLGDKSEELVTIYTAAANHQELLEQIPCYCGCGDSVGHRDSYDCFVHQNNADGSIVWDDHGTKCGVCLEIAAISMIEYQEGKSVEEIRDLIDEKYKEGFANPTPTPKPGS